MGTVNKKNKTKQKSTYGTDSNFGLCEMSLGEIKGSGMGAVGFFLSLMLPLLLLLPRHAITRSSASRPAPASKRAICMPYACPMHAWWLFPRGHLRRLTTRPAALAMRAVVIVPSGFPPLLHSSSPSQGDLQLKPRPDPCLQRRRRPRLAPREAVQGEWGITALRGPYRARLDERLCGGGLRSLDGAGALATCALETPKTSAYS